MDDDDNVVMDDDDYVVQITGPVFGPAFGAVASMLLAVALVWLVTS